MKNDVRVFAVIGAVEPDCRGFYYGVDYGYRMLSSLRYGADVLEYRLEAKPA
jgi:hypothetical protein